MKSTGRWYTGNHGLARYAARCTIAPERRSSRSHDLLHYLLGIGDAAGPERVPDGIDLVAEFAGEHAGFSILKVSQVFTTTGTAVCAATCWAMGV